MTSGTGSSFPPATGPAFGTFFCVADVVGLMFERRLRRPRRRLRRRHAREGAARHERAERQRVGHLELVGAVIVKAFSDLQDPLVAPRHRMGALKFVDEPAELVRLSDARVRALSFVPVSGKILGGRST